MNRPRAAVAPPAVRVVDSFGAVVQDLGRFGHEHGGINRSGATDTFSSRFGNLAVGNVPDAPCIEITGTSFALECLDDVVLAVTGAVAEVRVDGGIRVPQWEAIDLPRGSLVEITAPVAGYRSYVAVAGGVRAQELFGSVSPLPAFQFENPMGAGAEFAVGDAQVKSPACRGVAAHAAAFVERLRSSGRLIGVLETTQTVLFEGMERLYDRAYVMSARSNAVGARFNGDTPVRSDATELVSRGVPIGSIEIPSAGELIALLRGRLITAGYPVPAVIAKADIDFVAQLHPGEAVRFERIEEDEARRRLTRDELALRQVSLPDLSPNASRIRR